MDFDDILFQESSTYDKPFNELEDALQKRNESYLKLKKKIVATSSVLSRYRETQAECEKLKQTILDLSNTNEKLTKRYEESLRIQISLKQDVELYSTRYEKTLHTFNDAVEKNKAKTATIKQLKDLSQDLKNQLNSCTVESSLMKSHYKKKIEELKRDLSNCKSLKKSKRIKNNKYLETINNDDVCNSPASADTGKGSSICTSDDEKSLSVATTPRRDDPPSPLCSDHLLDNSEVNRCYVSVSTSPIPDVIQAADRGCTNNQIDKEYVAYILNTMTNFIKPISPIPWEDQHRKESVSDVTANKLCQSSPVKLARKYSSINRKRILSSNNLSNMFKRIAQTEISKLLSRIKKKHSSKNIIVNRKKINSDSESQAFSEISILRKIKNNLISKSVNTNKGNIRKATKLCKVKSSTTSKCVKKTTPIDPSDKRIPEIHSNEVMKNVQEIENEKKICEAKNILLKYNSLKDSTKEKTSIRWRVGSKIKNTSLVANTGTSDETPNSEMVKVPNNDSSQCLHDKANNDNTSESVSKIRKSKRKRKLENSNINLIHTDLDNNDGPSCIKYVCPKTTVPINYKDLDCPGDTGDANFKNIPVDDTVGDEYDPKKTYESNSAVFRTILIDYVQNTKKKHYINHVTPEDLCGKLEEFLTSNFTVENLENFISDLSTESEANIGSAIVEFLCSPNRYNDATLQHYPILPMTKSHQAVLVLINNMSSSPNVMELVMKGIEYKMFQLNKTPPVQSLKNMIPLYVALCRINKQKDRLKLLCLDALYCLSYSATPIVLLVLQCWPAIFPLANYSSANDPLFITMVHYLLSNFSDDCHYNSKNLQQLLCKKYGCKVGEYSDDQILELLLNIIKGNESKLMKCIISAFLLLGKRTGVEWCYNNIIVKSLLPIIDDPHSSSYTKSMAIRLMGPLTRPFPDTKTLQCGILFKKLINSFGTSNDPCIDEAILSSIYCFKKKDIGHTVQILMQWRPTYPVSQKIQAILESIINTKPKHYWICTLKKNYH